MPVAPSGLHQAPGYTVTPPEAGEVAAGTEGEVSAGDAAVGDVAVGDVIIVPISGASGHGAITKPTHDAPSRFLIRPHSL